MLCIDHADAVTSGKTITQLAAAETVIIAEFFGNVLGHEIPYCHLSVATEEQLLKITSQTDWCKIGDRLILADQKKSQVIEILSSL